MVQLLYVMKANIMLREGILLCCHETPHEVITSSSGVFSIPVGAIPEEATKMIKRMEHLSYAERLRQLLSVQSTLELGSQTGADPLVTQWAAFGTTT